MVFVSLIGNGFVPLIVVPLISDKLQFTLPVLLAAMDFVFPDSSLPDMAIVVVGCVNPSIASTLVLITSIAD